MIERPEAYIADFVKACADVITVHAEACTHLHRVIHMIKEHGIKAGVAINPATPASAIQEVLEDVDLVLVMTVNPGFGGQAFIPRTVHKIRQIRQWLNEASRFDVHIEVDGGITSETAPLVAEAKRARVGRGQRRLRQKGPRGRHSGHPYQRAKGVNGSGRFHMSACVIGHAFGAYIGYMSRVLM